VHDFDAALRAIDEDIAWDPARRVTDVGPLRRLAAGDHWGGPLVVSMPRTGSTLFGTLFLLLRDPPGDGDYVFDRYVHEPASPVFWEGRDLADAVSFIDPPLSSGDIVQESAYQFAAKPIAEWFLRGARRPVVFTVRHPQRAWPSRWRIMLRRALEADSEHPRSEEIAAALETEDYSGLGDLLTSEVVPPGNGWFAFLSAIDVCRREGIEHVVVDNRLFRSDPEGVLADLCARWEVPYDDSLVTWTDLSEVLDRVTMSPLASGEEFPWYYARTLGSSRGIVRTDRELVPLEHFPPEVRGSGKDTLTVDEAVEWYEAVLANSVVLGS
jgi:hypothetical protein